MSITVSVICTFLQFSVLAVLKLEPKVLFSLRSPEDDNTSFLRSKLSGQLLPVIMPCFVLACSRIHCPFFFSCISSLPNPPPVFRLLLLSTHSIFLLEIWQAHYSTHGPHLLPMFTPVQILLSSRQIEPLFASMLRPKAQWSSLIFSLNSHEQLQQLSVFNAGLQSDCPSSPQPCPPRTDPLGLTWTTANTPCLSLSTSTFAFPDPVTRECFLNIHRIPSLHCSKLFNRMQTPVSTLENGLAVFYKNTCKTVIT